MRTLLTAVGAAAGGLLAGLTIATVAGWLPAENPVIVGAVAFVAGGLFAAIIEFGSREISAHLGEQRAWRRQRRDAQTRAIEATLRWLDRFAVYLDDCAVGVDSEYDPEQYVAMRLGLIGDVRILERLWKAIQAMYLRSPLNPPTVEERVELVAARDLAQAALEDQADRIGSGLEPTVIDSDTVSRITATSALLEAFLASTQKTEPGR